LSDSPIPRWSTATTWKSRARVGMSSRQAYQVCGQPCTSSSGGPSPPTTACWRSPPASTNRSVNVSVNPAGRFGARATEPRSSWGPVAPVPAVGGTGPGPAPGDAEQAAASAADAAIAAAPPSKAR
jgi:hypothetical protein